MKRKININYILGGCIVILAVLCILSIRQPINFEKEQTKREAVVKERLMHIRMAEERYRKIHGTYTGSFDNLIREKLLADSLRYIPFSDKKPFVLATSIQMSKSGRQIPLMECSAGYEDYLNGLNKNEIENLTEKANMTGQFPGLKIGDLTEDNNNVGNWQ